MNIGPLQLRNLIWAYGAAPVHKAARECGLEIIAPGGKHMLRKLNSFAPTEQEQSIFWDRCMLLSARSGALFG